jgi:hypothetical protein
LGTTFSAGERVDVSKVPVGALVLIGLGVIFLLHTLDIWDFSAHRIWPLVLIGIGGWLLVRRLGLVGQVPPGFDRGRSCRRGLMGPAILLTLGFQFLLDSMGVIRFGRARPGAGGDRLVKDFPEYGWPGPSAGTAAIKWGPAFRICVRRGAAPVIPGSEAGGEKWLARCKPRPQLSNGRDSDDPWPVQS